MKVPARISREDTIELARLAWVWPEPFDGNAHNILVYEAADKHEQHRAIGALIDGGLREQWERDLLHRLTGIREPGPKHRPKDYRGPMLRNLIRALLRTAHLTDEEINAHIAKWSGREVEALERQRYRDKN